MLRRVFHFPSKNLITVIPAALFLGFSVGLFADTAFLKKYILVTTFLMIYPTMIGFRFQEGLRFTEKRLLLLAAAMNFLVIPVFAYFLGGLFFGSRPELLAGLAILAILPTSGMTISWTLLFKGNVAGAVKITAFGLVIGALLAPWYLVLTVGQFVPLNPLAVSKTISTVVFLPLVAGFITQHLLRRVYTEDRFTRDIRPLLPAASVWGLLALMFMSMSMKTKMILSQPELILQVLGVLALFYTVNFALGTVIGQRVLAPRDAVALVYGSAVRNLSISLGVAVATFGPTAALLVTLAFLVQVQAAPWYGKIIEHFGLIPATAEGI